MADVMVGARLPRILIDRIDAEARKRGVSRAQLLAAADCGSDLTAMDVYGQANSAGNSQQNLLTCQQSNMPLGGLLGIMADQGGQVAGIVGASWVNNAMGNPYMTKKPDLNTVLPCYVARFTDEIQVCSLKLGHGCDHDFERFI